MLLPADLPSNLAHVRWIGGGSGSAKSTIAGRLANTRRAMVYDTDSMMREHAARCVAEQCPRLTAFMQMDMDERWVRQTPHTMLRSFHWFAGEGFDFIVEDLLALPRDRPVVAEGFRLLPHLVVPLLENRKQAIWLLATPAFRRRAFDARGTTWDIPQRTSNPKRALGNLLARDKLFTEQLCREAMAFGLHTITVDGTLTEGALLSAVDDWLLK